MSRKPAKHPDPHVQRRIEWLRKTIAEHQAQLQKLLREGKQLRKAGSSATVAAPLPRRRVAGAIQPPP